jgi:predicted TIM-barrel fold metal-dependent hydrolase
MDLQPAASKPDQLIQDLIGEIVDVDSHEMAPAQAWEALYGESVRPFAEAWMNSEGYDPTDRNHPNVPGYPGDIEPIDSQVLDFKGPRAPGALRMDRRLDVMDATGIRRQLMFPQMSAYSFMLALRADDPGFMAAIRDDRRARGRGWMDLCNEWAIGVGKQFPRIRPVLPVLADSPAELIAKAQHLIKQGVRAIRLPGGVLPGGVSPAHPDLDPLWALCAEAGCAVTLHVGSDCGFLRTEGWRDIPAFEGFKVLGEFATDPWSRSTLHLPAQNFLATLVVGGVFERHPALRFGVIELGGYWIGPLMETLDLWHRNSKSFGPQRLPNDPSFYIKRNVRITPFAFEDVGATLAKYDLEDVLCFSSDYPHVEGGRDTIRRMAANLAPMGQSVVRKYFVDNGAWLFPE